MNIAVMILMHKNPEQLLRLVKYFQSDEFVCFIHIDKKLVINIEELKQQIKEIKKECVVLKERQSGTLADWSLVSITIQLLKNAKKYEKKTGCHFSYFQLCSGQDYPLRTAAEYINLLKQSYPQSFINLAKENSNAVKRQGERWRIYRIRNFVLTHFKCNKVLYFIFIAPVHLLEQVATWIIGTPTQKLQGHNIKMSGGSAWWTLTDNVIESILEEVEAGTMIVKVVKNIGTPEESFFQTIYINRYKTEPVQPKEGLTFSNFVKPDGTVDGHTFPLLEKDYDNLKIQREKFCFARKFDEKVDSRILDLIDNNFIYIES